MVHMAIVLSLPYNGLPKDVEKNAEEFISAQAILPKRLYEISCLLN